MEKINSKELAPIKSRQTKMEKVVNDLSITSDAELAYATKALSGIKDFLKQVATKEKEITGPLTEALKNTRALFLPFKVSAKSAEANVKEKMIVYNRELEEARMIEEEKLAKKVESGSLKEETAATKLEKIPEKKVHVAGEGGKGAVTFKKVKKFKVVDITKIPYDFLLPDEVKIRKAMYADIPISGVEYFEEDQVSAR